MILRVGIIGAGPARLVATAGMSPERLSAFAEDFDVPRSYRSATELIADPQVDLVAIATPTSSHEEAAIAALDAYEGS